ncbi:hypothetical protein [Rickettsia endosymbiont of Urophora cardui]
MIGDIINPIISAIGLNLRCIANHLQIVSSLSAKNTSNPDHL